VAELDRLIDFAKNGDVAGVRSVVASDPSVTAGCLATGETPLMSALYRGHFDVVSALIDLGAPLDAFAAAATGRLAELLREIDRPGALNAFAYDGWTPLHLAAFFGHLDAARALLDAGADLSAVSRNGMRNTPLHAAAAGRHGDVARLLVERGADGLALDAGEYSARAIAEMRTRERVGESEGRGPSDN
jgi:ankyrin repeat protein